MPNIVKLPDEKARKGPRRHQITSLREEEAEDEIKEYLSRQGHRERHNDGLAERDEDD
jgi:hypothetical protein